MAAELCRCEKSPREMTATNVRRLRHEKNLARGVGAIQRSRILEFWKQAKCRWIHVAPGVCAHHSSASSGEVSTVAVCELRRPPSSAVATKAVRCSGVRPCARSAARWAAVP